jgi:hypothetical protein
VEVGSSVALRALACLREEETNGSEIDSDQLPALPVCRPSIRQGTWRVNGIVGGNNSVGVISTGGGSGAEVLYIAPNNLPAPNPVTAVVSLYWPKRKVTAVLNNSPSKITVVGKTFQGTASGTVASGLANVGALYDYQAKVTWTRQGSLFPGLPAQYVPSGYIKYTARNRCISQMKPDSIPITPNQATLAVNWSDSTWTVSGLTGLIMPQIQYFDTCAKMPSYLEVSAAPYIWDDGGQHLPVQGRMDLNQGLKITASFSYLREGESVGPAVGVAAAARR